ncbi:MAG TPA: alginate export family protein [Vicinamibacteria bacterium]
MFTGTMFTRYEMRANYDDMGVSRARFLEGDATFYRLRFGIGTGLIDIGKGLKVGLQFTPQAAGVFGALGPNTVVDATLGLHEGYGRVAGTYMRFDAGRFELNYGDALVIGNLDWNEVGRSFDGVRARLSSSPTGAWLDLFATMVDEGRDPSLTGPAAKGLGFGDGDLYFYGAYAAIGPALMPGLDLDLYALAQGFHGVKNLKLAASDPMSPLYSRESATQVTFGARIKQKIKFLDYRVEAGLQTGSRPGAVPTVMPMVPPPTRQAAADVSAYHVDAEVGLNLFEDKLRLAAEGIYASGDDAKSKKNEGWDELYPTAHKWLGLADVFHQRGVKRTNVTSGVLHLTVKATKDLSVQADGHLFMRPEKIGLVDGRAGAEIDVGASYVLGKGLKVRALYAAFMPDKEFYPLAPAHGQVDPIHYAEVELRYDLAPWA